MLFLANGSHEPTWTVRQGGERGGGHRRKRTREGGSHRLYENNTFKRILFPVTNRRSDCCRIQYVVQMSSIDYIGRIFTAFSIQSYSFYNACCRFLGMSAMTAIFSVYNRSNNPKNQQVPTAVLVLGGRLLMWYLYLVRQALLWSHVTCASSQ